MKITTFILILFCFCFNFATAQTTKTVGGSGTIPTPHYATLQAAFAAINSGAIQGQIILEITGNTTETSRPFLYASGTGSSNYTSVLIYPTGTFSITATTETPSFGNFALIDLDGADNVTIDGRINRTGTPNSLTITGTSTENGAAGIRFVNSAENNTVKYCNINACSASSSMGIVAFGGSSTGNGNDNNIVENCNLTKSGTNRPYNAILSAGTGGRENNNCIIRNNNIYDTFQRGVSSNGININSASVGFTISGNSIYETAAFETSVAAALSYNAIRVSTTSEHTITGNYIGGSAPQCVGTWSFLARHATYFCGIYAYAGNIATTISNNTISNINYSSKEDNPWDGIFLFSGNFDVSGNTIGATTGTGSITLTTSVPLATTTLAANPGGISNTITVLNGGSGYTTAPVVTFTNPPTGGTAPTATANLTGGVVTSITVNTPGSGYTSAPAVIFDGQSNNYSTSHGMIQNSTGTVNITGNNIGSITTIGSTHYSHGFESIYVRTVPGTTSITNNLIGSLGTPNSINVSSEAASSIIKQDVYGIYSAGTGTTTITGNTVANLTNAYKGTNSGARNRGIQTTGGTNMILNNTVRNISTSTPHANAGSAAALVGISQTSTTGTTQTVNGNTVYDLSNTSGTAKVQLFGMYYAGPSSGTNSVSGNFVHSLSASSSDIGAVINGIFINSGMVTCANNIINLGGSSLGYLINGIWDGTLTDNNVSFYFNSVYIGGNVSAGVTSNTACLWNANINTTNRDYRNNIFYNARTGGTTGKHYAIRIAGTTGLTINYNDYFVSGTNGVLGYLATDKSTLALLQAATGQDVNSRDINPGFTLAGGTSAINYYPSATLTGVTGTGITTDYYGITRVLPKMGALEQNGNVWQGGTSTDFNTASNWANSTVPGTGADIIFATSPTNDCVLDASRTVGSITNGSSKNLMVNGHTLTVNGSLNFTSSGKINTSTASSEVKFAGSTAQTIPAAAFVSNSVAGLEIANSSGVALNGDLTVSAALTLTSGVITVGANTLTISANTLTRTSGGINASNANATLDFANSSALTLPTSVFSTDITNLTISGAGGLTASGDITVNGVLNLAAANPSATKGLLEMVISYTNYPGTLITHYLNSYLLNMGASATTIGIGDVTGTVKRATIVANTPYTFGNQFTTISLTTGTMPSALAVSITIGTSPGLSTPANDIIRDAIKRTYEIVPTGGSDCYLTANFHYLDTELTSSNNPYHVNTEQKLTTMDYDIDINNHGYPYSDEHGRANYDYTNNYIGLSSVPISYFIQIPTTHEWRTIFTLRDYGEGYFTWDGSKNTTTWNDPDNWTVGVSGSGVPTTTGHVIIPNAGTTPYDPVLPSGNTIINTISIENGGVLTMGSNTLTIQNTFSGGWEDQNPYGNDPGTSTVVFALPSSYTILPHTTISGNARFYNVEIGAGADVAIQAGSTMRIAGSITKTGIWTPDIFDATVEYNGADQTIIHPDGTFDYHNLILSGSGTKSLPSSLNMHGDFIITGTTEAVASGSVTTGGIMSVGPQAKYTAGAHTHTNGNFIIYSDATGTGSLIATSAFSGTVERWMSGDIWHLISPAATGGENVASFVGATQNANLIARNTNNYGLAPYNEATDEWDYFKTDGSNTGDNFGTPGKGFQVLRAPGAGTGKGTDGGEGIVSFIGTLAAGDKTIEIARTSFGWNLIGNPYPCALDIKKFLDANSSIVEKIPIDQNFLGIYVTDVADITNYGYIPVNYSNGANDLKLASGEAFFVKSKTGGGTINFTTAMKTHTSDAFKSAVIQNGFNLIAASGGDKMSTTVKYIPQMTAGLDPGWDAGLFYNGEDSPLSLYTRLVEDNGVDFTIQCLPDNDYENLVVPVGITAKKGATVTFSLADITIPVGYKVFIEDRTAQKFTRIDEPGSAYLVQLKSGSNGTGRFFLHTKQEITGIKDAPANDFVVIPLPQHRLIRVSGLVNLPAQATVYDMNGRTITIKTLTAINENDIQLNGVSNGIYLLKIKSGTGTTQHKISWTL
jgi:hypothetical protein